ncbi:BZ3500_MvSof-1268-A1-R1_Chr7-1g09328 [Microbotryum saponariae]|uniref:BZ3500_MvSof-1268-A1-R1_Chr7-1g09328 protein n=1 Tax=Microbotryum saponariae TaxID=289078 RepID=A0A2X0N1B1_9BASI|nr:BZ3501_MvSof-1269-A2-R1_Chr7-1g09033 [Microbotryum saponariae]SDA03240.1 BZ3500_MvSof-1268-A1-R1_Chr7-1g09328 [Microbotryum saponariae]
MQDYDSRIMMLMACDTLCCAVGCAAAIVLGGRLLCKIRWQRPAVRPVIAAMAAPSCTLARALAPATWANPTVTHRLDDWFLESLLLASVDTSLALFSLNVVHNACFGLKRITVILSMFAIGSVAASRVSPLAVHLSYPFNTASVLHILSHIAFGLVGALFLRLAHAAGLDNYKAAERIGPSVRPAGTAVNPCQHHSPRAPQGDQPSARDGINLGIHRAALVSYMRNVSNRQFVKVAPFVAALHCSKHLQPGLLSSIVQCIPFVNVHSITNSALDGSVHLVASAGVYALRWAVRNVLVITLSFVLVSKLRWPTFNLVPLRLLSRSIRRISAQGHQNATDAHTGVNHAESDEIPQPSVERMDVPDGHGGERGAPLVAEPSNRSRSPTVTTQPYPLNSTSPAQVVFPAAAASHGESQQQPVEEPAASIEAECNVPSSSNGPYWHTLETSSKKQSHPSGSGWRRRRVRMRTSLGTILTTFSPKHREHSSPVTETRSASSSQVDPVDVRRVLDEHDASPKPSQTTAPNGRAERSPQVIDRATIQVAEPEVSPSMPAMTTEAIEPSSTPREARKSVFIEQLGTSPQNPIPEVTLADTSSPFEPDSELNDRPNSRWLLPPLTSRSLTAPTTPPSPPIAERLTRAASMEAMHQITRSLLCTPRTPRSENGNHNRTGRFSSIASRMGVPSHESPATPTSPSGSTSPSSPTSPPSSPTSLTPPRTPETPNSSIPASPSTPPSRSRSSQPYSTPQRVISASKRLHRQAKDIVVPNSRDSVHSSSELSFHCAGDSEVLEILVTTTRTQVTEEDGQVGSPTSESTADGGAQVAESSHAPSEKVPGGIVARARTMITKKTKWWNNPISSTRMRSRSIFHKAIKSPLARSKRYPAPVNTSQLDLFSPRPPSIQDPNDTTTFALGSPISDSFWRPESTQRSRSEPPSLREPSRPKPSRARIAEERPSLFLLSLEDHQASPGESHVQPFEVNFEECAAEVSETPPSSFCLADTPELVDLWKDVMEWKRTYHGHGDSCEELRSDGSSFPSVCEQYPDFPQVPSRGLRSTSTFI